MIREENTDDQMSDQEHPDTPPTTHTEQPVDPWSFGAELFRTIVIIGVLAFLIRYFLIQPFIVEGESMSPTFHTSDYLLVDKLDYRFHSPERGDIIVFKYPGDTSVNYVKRVIGLPGDTITIKNGGVTITNAAHPKGFVLDESYLPAGLQTTTIDDSSNGVYAVHSGEYFVMGDNRPDSSDSRSWGFLPQNDLIGRVALELLPLDQAKIIHQVSYPS